jgi:Fic family protein
MHRDIQGYTIPQLYGDDRYGSFVPHPLPPNPPIAWSSSLRSKFDQAILALGRLDCMATLLPDVTMFLYAYVRKEAVLSSMIEGTQSSLADLMLFELDEIPGVPLDDVREVSNYVRHIRARRCSYQQRFSYFVAPNARNACGTPTPWPWE